jgi:hypothetical protein
MSELARQSIFRDPPRIKTPKAGPYDARLLEILRAPIQPGETAYLGYLRKEHELGEYLGALSVADQRALYVRLSNPRDDDELAHDFHLLVATRRARILAFLADAPRRAAITAARSIL